MNERTLIALPACLTAGLLATTTLAGEQRSLRVSVLETAPSTASEQSPKSPPVALDNLHNMIGQMIMVGYHGKTASSKGVSHVRDLLRDGTIGGVILMQRNISSLKRLKEMTSQFHNAGSRLPPFISIDQEGGAVQRLKARNGFQYTPSAARVARRMKPEQAEELYGKLAKQLREAGINMNFGPVVDLGINKRNPIVTRRGRTYGDDPQTVTSFARAFIKAHEQAGVMTVAKHFPGHGSSWADSHRSFVDLSKTWKPVELEPFALLSQSGAPSAVMVGHLYHPDFSEEEKRPASLSKTAIDLKLRKGLGFKGLVITDDLEMSAVRKRYSLEELSIRAIEAGNDIILYSNPTFPKRHTPELIHKHIRDAVMSGRLSRERISKAYQRIKAHKLRLLEQALLSETSSPPAEKTTKRCQLADTRTC